MSAGSHSTEAMAPEAPVAGGRRAGTVSVDGIAFDSAVAEPVAPASHGLTGTDEAGSGGDDELDGLVGLPGRDRGQGHRSHRERSKRERERSAQNLPRTNL